MNIEETKENESHNSQLIEPVKASTLEYLNHVKMKDEEEMRIRQGNMTADIVKK